ncbi:hypothetical protein B5G34_04460 [Flavonifractor sp. An82]|nr:hypothetical protein B5G34_04460 [Flavonifractor sp. An82]
MGGQGTIQAGRVCGAMIDALCGEVLSVEIHSQFQNAINLKTSLGLITLLAPGRCLQPYSMVLQESMEQLSLEPSALALGSGGLWSDGALAVDFASAPKVDLLLRAGPTPPLSAARSLRRFLACAPGDGLSPLALNRVEGPFATLLVPRLEVLRRAVRAGDSTAALAAARRVAGCGPGLTPSSDDLLCGYLSQLPRSSQWADLTAGLARAAAEETNDISAALLLRAGDGLYSEDVLALIACLRHGRDGQELTACLLRVARFGSSSGYDFLTGVYFGILDACAIGGIHIGQT